MKIAHVIGIFSAEHGGPVVSCRNYALGQSDRGHELSVYTVDGYPRMGPAISLPPTVKQTVEKIDWPSKLGRSSGLKKAITEGQQADIYHLHGIWLRVMYYGYEKAVKTGRPYLIEINGALDPLELATKSWRKKLIRWWYQDKMLHKANCIHVNSEREAKHVRALGFRNPIAIIPAGFNFTEFDRLAKQARMATPAWAAAFKGRKILLYLARIHPAKGIDDLLSVWPSLADAFPDWDLLVVGPGDFPQLEALKGKLDDAGVAVRCHWIGMVGDIDRAWAYTHADLYVLPSHKENFGNTVQEALGYGTPVVTTDQTPWRDLEPLGCGWICHDNCKSLGETLFKALGTSEKKLAEMGENGRKTIQQLFSLDSVIEKQLSVYQWLTGGPEPECLWKF